MGSVEFTQYLRPDGRKRIVSVDLADEYSSKAKILKEKGCQFEIEELMNGMIHMDCIYDDEPLSNKLCQNGPDVVNKVEELIVDSFQALKKMGVI